MKKTILALSFLVSLALPALSQDLVAVAPGETKKIDAHNVCRMVENKNQVGLMVPTRSPGEWSVGSGSFLASALKDVNVSACALCNGKLFVDTGVSHTVPTTEYSSPLSKSYFEMSGDGDYAVVSSSRNDGNMPGDFTSPDPYLKFYYTKNGIQFINQVRLEGSNPDDAEIEVSDNGVVISLHETNNLNYDTPNSYMNVSIFERNSLGEYVRTYNEYLPYITIAATKIAIRSDGLMAAFNRGIYQKIAGSWVRTGDIPASHPLMIYTEPGVRYAGNLHFDYIWTPSEFRMAYFFNDAYAFYPPNYSGGDGQRIITPLAVYTANGETLQGISYFPTERVVSELYWELGARDPDFQISNEGSLVYMLTDEVASLHRLEGGAYKEVFTAQTIIPSSFPSRSYTTNLNFRGQPYALQLGPSGIPIEYLFMNIKRDGSGIIIIGKESDGKVDGQSRKVIQEYNFSGNDLVFAGQSFAPNSSEDLIDNNYFGVDHSNFQTNTSRGSDKLYYVGYEYPSWDYVIRILTAAPGCAP